MVETNRSGSKHRECRLISGRLCTLHTKQKGMPKTLLVPCKVCKEWRCKDHCKCGREGTATGRNRARNYGAALGARPRTRIVVPAPDPVPVVPVARPVADTNMRMDSAEWWRQVLAAVENAKHVELCSYMFDETALFKALLRRLSDESDFQLNMCLDEEIFMKGETPKWQCSRTAKLQKKGAAVFLCSGMGRLGSYHVKELVVDRRTLFTGSSNSTIKSHNNRERCYKMTGQVVSQALTDIASDKKEGRIWKAV